MSITGRASSFHPLLMFCILYLAPSLSIGVCVCVCVHGGCIYIVGGSTSLLFFFYLLLLETCPLTL